MIKDKHKVIIIAIFIGISVWIMWAIDALIDSLIFSKGAFLNLLIPINSHELYFRSICSVSFILFGIAVAGLLSNHEEVEESLIERKEKYRSLIESIGDFIYLVDKDYRYMFMNKKHMSRLGLTEDRLLFHGYSDFHSPEETKEFFEKIDQVFKTGETIQYEHLSRRDNRYFLRTLSPVKDADGTINAVTVVSKDINELKQLEEKLRTLSLTDELTGLYNRRGFFTMVEQILRSAKRQKKGVFILYADIDNFKEINDTWGHHEGDRALIDIANILRVTYRESDIIARIGGDEFVAVPMGLTGSDTEIITDRLQKNLTDLNEKGDRNCLLSISFGMSYYDPESPSSIDELLIQADNMMYEQKMLKGNLNSPGISI